jgi:hypothetical protein
MCALIEENAWLHMVPSDIIKIGLDEVLWCEGVKSHFVVVLV